MEILKWTLKADPTGWLEVYADSRNTQVLRCLARILYNSGLAEQIKIVSSTNTTIETWTKGYGQTPTDIFRDQVEQVLGTSGTSG